MRLFKRAEREPYRSALQYIEQIIVTACRMRAAAMADNPEAERRRAVDDLIHDMRVILDEMRRDHG